LTLKIRTKSTKTLTDPDPKLAINKLMYKKLRERVIELNMQYIEPLAAILLEQLEEPTEKW
jgi:hypothetical protein